MPDITFLSIAEVIEIHSDQISRYGGSSILRDIQLLKSALAMPEAGFDGEMLHDDIYKMAAAYAFHITKNHPFMDGNKRTALACALVFLEINRISLLDPNEKLYSAMLDLSSGGMDKKSFADVLRNLPEKDN